MTDPEQTPMLTLHTQALPDLHVSVRGVYLQGAFRDMCILVAYDSRGKLRRKVEVSEDDMEPDEADQMRAWLDRHDPI